MELFSAVSEWFFQDLIGGNWTFYLQNLPRLLVAGLLEGMILAVIALAFVLIYRTTEIVNFAQGDFMALSIFIMLVLTQWIGPEMVYGVYPDGPWSMLVPWLISAVLTIVLMIGFSIGADLLIFRNLAGQSPLAIVIITIALGFIIRNGLDVIVKPDAAASVPFPLAKRYNFDLGFFNIDISELITLIAVPLLLVAVVLFLNRTKVGVAVQASSQNQMAAYYMGIPVPRLNTLVWGIAGALTACAGILFALNDTARVNSAVGLTLQGGILAYAAAIAGGFGSITGAILAAILLGITHQMLQGAPGVPSFVGVNAPILFLLAILFLRPGGLVSQIQVKKSEGGERIMRFQFKQSYNADINLFRDSLTVRDYLIVLAVFMLAPMVMLSSGGGSTLLDFGTKILIFSIAGLGMMILTGFTGVVSLGHAAFMLLGAYLYHYLLNLVGADTFGIWAIISGLITAIIVAGIGYLVARPALRMTGIFCPSPRCCSLSWSTAC